MRMAMAEMTACPAFTSGKESVSLPPLTSTSMNRNLLIIIGILLAIIATMLTGNIIVIGDKLGRLTHVYVEYAFYGVILTAGAFYIVRPIIKVHRAPEFPKLSAEGLSTAPQLRTFARRLANNCDYIADRQLRRSHRSRLLKQINFHSADAGELRDIIAREITLRMEGNREMGVLGVDNRIREWGKTVFMVTALSQNSKFDTVAVLVMNYRLIADVVLASGFRPTKPQMFKLYVKVLTTALVTYCTSQVFTDMDGIAPFDFGDGAAPDISVDDADDLDVDADSDGGILQNLIGNLQKIKIPGFIVGSLADGSLNALLTLRIGYVTKAYLTEGPSALSGSKNKRRVKRQAIKSSFKAMPAVISAGSRALGKTVSGMVSQAFSQDSQK